VGFFLYFCSPDIEYSGSRQNCVAAITPVGHRDFLIVLKKKVDPINKATARAACLITTARKLAWTLRLPGERVQTLDVARVERKYRPDDRADVDIGSSSLCDPQPDSLQI
jgi:hypothetical protein